MFQLDKRFISDQVKELLERYLKNEIKRNYIQEILGIKKRSVERKTVSLSRI